MTTTQTTHIQHYINGQRTDGSSTRTADVFNPSTGEVQAQVVLASDADVDAVLDVLAGRTPAHLVRPKGSS